MRLADRPARGPLARRLGIPVAGVFLALAAVLAAPSAAPAQAALTQAEPVPTTAGRLLVALPDMTDAFFARTVILMVRHDADGAMGLIVNRPGRNVAIADIFGELGLKPGKARGSVTVHLGGPVALESGFALHTSDVTPAESIAIGEKFALSSLDDILPVLAKGRTPAALFIALGFAGWAAGQLDDEIRAGAWVTVPAEPDIVFAEDPDEAWERAFARRSISL